MKRVVWKFPVVPSVINVLMLPGESRFLSVQTQAGQPVMWWSVPMAATGETQKRWEHKFLVVGTGHEYEGSGTDYLGTFQVDDGKLVFHVFEVL